MELSIQKLSKSFRHRIVFQDLTLSIASGSRLAITGPNGSGKSTLLKILSSGSLPTSGKVNYRKDGKHIPEDQIYKYLHFIAPYNTVIEELTLPELFHFHQKLGLLNRFGSYKAWVDHLEYDFKEAQQIKSFSSGMKQRIRLGLALLDDRPLLLLDEPGSNLDDKGKSWFYHLLDQLSKDQTLIIASNDQREIAYCNQFVQLG
jgi:ABC-type multidrug transport system ATPase subunit